MTAHDTRTYVGQELETFAHAVHWKGYWTSRIQPWIKGDVLEVGAGIGGNTRLLYSSVVRSWVCLDPDPRFAQALGQMAAEMACCRSITGSIASVRHERFDTILYVDVLEHIERDADELIQAANLLRPGGHLIVLSPAHQILYSKFDAAVGHCRRYSKATLRRCSPPSCHQVALFYLDCAGMLASLANRIMLHQSVPTIAQIKTWDNYIIPVSRILDPLLGYTLGKTVVAVWTRMVRET
jgi:2-polyprenyl-3-methyl-5-hydroxy-6-metoxy-1,4-benzoquinol methylase